MELQHIGAPTEMEGPLDVIITGEESARLAGVLMVGSLAIISLALSLEKSPDVPRDAVKALVDLSDEMTVFLSLIGKRQHGESDNAGETLQ